MRTAPALLAALTTLFTTSSALASPVKSDVQYWNETKLTLSDLGRLLQHEDCYASDDIFLACIAAVENSLVKTPKDHPTQADVDAAEADEKAGKDDTDVLTWSAELATHPVADKYELVQDFGAVKLMHRSHVEVSKAGEKKGAKAEFDELLEKYRKFRKLAQDLKTATAQKPIDFPAILKWIETKRIDPKDEGFHAALGADHFFMTAFDPHTVLWSTQKIADERSGKSIQKFGGIGVNFKPIKNEKTGVTEATVISVRPGSPAAKADIRWKDVFAAVNGIPVLQIEGGDPMNTKAIMVAIRGAEGTPVEVSFNREGESSPLVKMLIRSHQTEGDEVVVSAAPIADRDHKVGYVQLTQFSNPKDCADIRDGILANQAQGAEALIFDLREDPGGAVPLAQCVGGLFLGSNRALFETEPFTRMTKFPSDMLPAGVNYKTADFKCTQSTPFLSWGACSKVSGDPVTNMPIVVLIDSASGSASEIIASALQDHAQVEHLPIWIAGAQSYGKATMQKIFDFGQLADDNVFDYALAPGVSVGITIARFRRAGGRIYEGEGVIPDYPMGWKPNMTEDEAFAMHEKDRFPNYVPPADDLKWAQLRGAEIARNQACMSKTGIAAKLYAEGEAKPGLAPPDYQRMQAMDLIHCLLTQPTAAPLASLKP